ALLAKLLPTAVELAIDVVFGLGRLAVFIPVMPRALLDFVVDNIAFHALLPALIVFRKQPIFLERVIAVGRYFELLIRLSVREQNLLRPLSNDDGRRDVAFAARSRFAVLVVGRLCRGG